MTFRKNQKIVDGNTLYEGNTRDGVPHGEGQMSNITFFHSFKGKFREGVR